MNKRAKTDKTKRKEVPGFLMWEKQNKKEIKTNDKPETVSAAKALGWKLLT